MLIHRFIPSSFVSRVRARMVVSHEAPLAYFLLLRYNAVESRARH